jgi:apolipoprotein N-acyltransferase
MIADVPTKGVLTIYSRLGDWFAWVCLVVLLFVAAIPWLSKSPELQRSL